MPGRVGSLDDYRRKRDFRKSGEPRGKRRGRKRRAGPLFVVQKHDASRLHYDFRLEVDGVLKSWAVPKGPSLDPGQRRLAVRVEDHPLEYGDFEGVIPEGEYGGGTVLLWDRGSWHADGDAERGLRQGKLAFTLEGEKLRGAWVLVRMSGDSGEGGRNWLLIKEKDAGAHSGGGELVDARPESVATGRGLEEIATARAKAEARGGAKGKRRGGRTVREKKGAAATEVAGVRLSHPDKVLYPEQGVTKLDLARYYERVAEWMLPHVAGRPLTVVRCPAGRQASCFYQKHAQEGMPDAIRQVEIAEKEGEEAPYLMIDSAAGLVALVQMGVLEIHIWGSRARALERPDLLVFDLDPGPGVEGQAMVDAARRLRGILEALRLESFLKASGGKGLHVIVPLAGCAGWDTAKEFSREVARLMAASEPERYTATMSKKKRRGKIYVDYLRNQRGATAIAPYSTRARPGAPVATPLRWGELSPKIRPDRYDLASLPRRLGALRKDPWEGFFDLQQRLSKQAIKALRSDPARLAREGA